MISDYSVPAGSEPKRTDVLPGREDYLAAQRTAAQWTAAQWTVAELGSLATALDEDGREVLGELSNVRLLAAWDTAIGRLIDPSSAARQALDASLTRTCRLSAPALQAALETVLEGMTGDPAREVFDRAERLSRSSDRLVLAILASNVPALAAQVVLPALALRRPLLLKSSSREPLFGPALVHLLGRELPELSRALAAVTWAGGDEVIEDRLFSVAGSVVAYGDSGTIDQIAARRGDLLPQGSKISIAAVGADSDLDSTARGLARDIALLEQRGCLSVRAVFTDADPVALGTTLRDRLAGLAEVWPPYELEPSEAAAVRQARDEAELRGALFSAPSIGGGTVILAPNSELRPGPGCRTVEIHALESLDALATRLSPWADGIQGAVLAGEGARASEALLRSLGVARITAPGLLQRTDALWSTENGGLFDHLA